MTKAEMVAEISTKTGIEKVDVSAVIEATFGIIKKQVIARKVVTVRGFGTFGAKRRAEKPCRNITKGTTMIVPAHDIPFFKVSPEFKDALK